jgi:hypothetical protein
VIQIESDGDPGTATFALAIDSGPFIFQGPLNALTVLGDGTSVVAISGATPSFIAGDIFVFSTPGTPNYVQGNDVESDESLAARCASRWPAQSLNVLDGKVLLWVRLAYPPANRVNVAPDAVTPGRFIVTLADSHGGVDQAALDAVEAFIVPRLGVGEGVGAVAAVNLGVTAAGNVRVPVGTSAADLEQVQLDADDAWRKHLAGIGGGGVVRVADLVAILIDAGALDAGDSVAVTLSTPGTSWPVNVPVPPGDVPVVAAPLATSMTWGFA